MDYNEFAQRIKNKYPEYKDMDNKELSEKIIAKYPEYKSQVTFENIDSAFKENKGIDITPSGLAKKASVAISTPIRQLRYGESKDEARANAETLINKAFKNNISVQGLGLATDIAPYFTMPQLNAVKGASLGAKAANLGLTGAYQGGIAGGLESLKQEGDLSGIGTGSLVGAATGAGLPVGWEKIKTPIKNVLNNPQFKEKTANVIETITSVPSEYTQRALDKELLGQTIFKGKFNPKTAYQGIEKKLVEAKSKLPSKEYYKEQYKKLGDEVRKKLNANLKEESYFDEKYNELGQKALDSISRLNKRAADKVTKATNELRKSEKRVNISDLKDDITSTFNQYQGEIINPAKNMTGSLEKDLVKLVESGRIGTDDFIASKYPQQNVADIKAVKDREEEAFSILEKATGKSKDWLRMQLKAYNPTVGTGKRQEGIENIVLDKVDDKLTPEFLRGLKYYRPSLDFNDISAGSKVTEQAFDDIINRRINTNALKDPMQQAFEQADYDYYNLLKNTAENINNPNVFDDVYSKLEKITRNLPEGGEQQYYNKLADDIDELYKRGATVSPIDLQKIKEQIGKMTNWDDITAQQYKNPILEQIYGKFNNRLSELSPDLAEANKIYSSIMDLEKSTGGLNPSTIGTKLRDYGTGGQLRSGSSQAINDINNLLPIESRFLNEAIALNNQRNAQNLLRQNVGESVLNDISRLDNAPYATQDAVRNLAPEEVGLYQRLANQQKQQDEIMRTISGKAYERNPRLLANRNDLAGEQALDYLQSQSGINFMDELNDIRAREALESWLPGQGGGSGGGQGFANLVRSGLTGSGLTAAVTLQNPLLAAPFSLTIPRIGAKGTIQNLGRLNRLTEKEIPQGVQRLLPPVMAQNPLLYGQVEYNENR